MTTGLFYRGRTWGRIALVPLVIAGAFLVACGDDEPDAEVTTTATAEATSTDEGTATPTGTAATGTATATESATATGEVAEGTIEVTAVDYAFEGLPERIRTGSTIELTNESEVEAHEFVAYLVPEGETRTAEELVQLPTEELEALFADDPALVILAAPATGPDENIIATGDGTLATPGTYLVICGIPVGADPVQVLGSDAPIEDSDAPPHFAEGMYAEVTVE